jgi:hypothetical protein
MATIAGFNQFSNEEIPNCEEEIKQESPTLVETEKKNYTSKNSKKGSELLKKAVGKIQIQMKIVKTMLGSTFL